MLLLLTLENVKWVDLLVSGLRAKLRRSHERLNFDRFEAVHCQRFVVVEVGRWPGGQRVPPAIG